MWTIIVIVCLGDTGMFQYDLIFLVYNNPTENRSGW